MNREFDIVIVGAGSAGCVLASRLTEDHAVTVLALEAGPEDHSVFIHMPAAMSYPLTNERFNWNYASDPEPALNGRSIDVPRGRVLGGSSSINGLVFVRGNPLDYDGWAARGLKSWSYAHCLPYFRRMETFDGGADDYRGASGPLGVGRCKADNPLFQAFLEAGPQAGFPVTPDHNGQRQEGMHVAQMTIRDGRRASTAICYLHPARSRPNLSVETGALVQRIVFDGRRAVGVVYQRRGETQVVHARREVILCAGSIGSPQVLLLSGVGDPQHLAEFDIPLVADVPGVGRGLEDHPAFSVQHACASDASPAARLGPLGQVRIGLEWILFKRGLGRTNFFDTGGFLRTSDDIDYVNLQYEFLALRGSYGSGKVSVAPGFQYSTSIMRPSSKGRVKLASSDPRRHPSIAFNDLAEPDDQRQMIDGLRITRRIIAQKAWDAHRGPETAPGPDVVTDKDILAWLRANVHSEYHPSGTCRMGVGDDSVTDEDGRVHGVEGLRVVDASLMPRIVTANLNGPVIMMAEKLADRIAGRPPLAPVVVPVHRA